MQRQCDRENDRAFCKEQFLKAVRKFMEMKTLTPTSPHEIVERIDVYHIQGKGKDRTAYALARRKDFPAFQVGGRILVSTAGLAAWVEHQTVEKSA